MLRRQFIAKSFRAAATAAISTSLLRAETTSKSILVLGGTFFLGPAIVEAAMADGHKVTLLNRGVTNPGLFPYVEKLRGFRSPNSDDQNISALGQRHWDVVIDVWPYEPVLVESAARRLKDRTKHYLYVSSVGAYDTKDFSQPNVSEDGATVPWAIVPRESTGDAYDRGKAESERRLRAIIGERLTVVRPGPIKGIRDDTPDILIWLRRMQQNSTVIAPGDGSDPVEIVDVNDVAEFLMLAIDRPLYGTFNVTGRPMSFRSFLDDCRSATHSNAELVWITEAFLRNQGLVLQGQANWLRPFPYWKPDPSWANFSRISSAKAYDAGWQTRPFRNTAIDYLAYIASLPAYVFQDTLSPERHAEVLNLWRNGTR
jgi:2'-hydroxyisoflavone reductase